VYKPSDDSFLLADNIEVKENEKVLDMGVGCGIQGIIASQTGGIVTSSDKSEEALKCARRNALLNGVDITFVKSDLFEDIEEKFDLITFNPPYLPTGPEDLDDELDTSLDGGETGREVTEMFLKELKNHLSKGGRALLVTSTLSIPENPSDIFAKHGLAYEIIDEKPLFFEKLYLYMIRR
jgi:release factor glutamine methyltransferase